MLCMYCRIDGLTCVAPDKKQRRESLCKLTGEAAVIKVNAHHGLLVRVFFMNWLDMHACISMWDDADSDIKAGIHHRA